VSIDYCNIAQAMPSAKALFDQLSPYQWCGDIIGPAEQTLLEAWSGIRDIDLAGLASEFQNERPSIACWDSAVVKVPLEMLELLDQGCLSNRASALSAIDRILAIPAGVNFMSGHAVALIPADRTESLALAMHRIWSKLGGRAKAAAFLTQYIHGNANEEVCDELISNLYSAFAKAKATRWDVLLVSADIS
jgi:hypothetical protein